MYWTLLWSMFNMRKRSGSEFTMTTFILPQVNIPKTRRHGRIKKYTTKRTMKFTEKNYKMKRNSFVFKEREVFKKRRNIIEKGQDTMNFMEKMTKNILRVYKRKRRKKNMIFYHPVQILSGIRQR